MSKILIALNVIVLILIVSFYFQRSLEASIREENKKYQALCMEREAELAPDEHRARIITDALYRSMFELKCLDKHKRELMKEFTR